MGNQEAAPKDPQGFAKGLLTSLRLFSSRAYFPPS